MSIPPLRRLAAPIAALALLAAAPATAGGSWASLRRPLQLRPLPAGARCPASARHRLDHGRLTAVGPGPIYPMPSPVDRYDRRPAWLGSKTIWAWPTRLVTRPQRVLVRGLRLDRPGRLRFQLGPQWDAAPVTRELHVDTGATVGSFGSTAWGATVTMLLVHAPGCYGLQLDTASGTSIVVVDLRHAARR